MNAIRRAAGAARDAFCDLICGRRADTKPPPSPMELEEKDEIVRTLAHAQGTTAANMQGVVSRLKREIAHAHSKAQVDLDEALVKFMQSGKINGNGHV